MQTACWMLIAVLAGPSAWGGDPPRVVLRTVDRDRVGGRLLALSAGAGMTIQTVGSQRLVVRLPDLVQARLDTQPGRDQSAGQGAVPGAKAKSDAGWPRVFATRDGQRLVGRCAAGDERRVTVGHSWLGELVLLRRGLAWIGPRGGADHRSPVLSACGGPGRADEKSPNDASGAKARSLNPDDEIRLSNGDVVAGSVLALDADRVRVDADSGEVSIAWSKVARVTFGGRPVGAGRPAVAGSNRVQAILELTDGSRLLADGIEYADGRFRWSTGGNVAASDERLALPADRVARIRVRGGRWRWLSDLRPVAIDSRPMFGLNWPPMRDRNVLGGPISINAVRYDRGVGVHASCSLGYALDGRYDRFVSRIGLDDDSGDWANVDVQVVVDGQVRFSASAIRRGDVRPPIRVDLSGARGLQLIVAAGANGDVQDRFNWAEAGLVRAAAPPATLPSTHSAGER